MKTVSKKHEKGLSIAEFSAQLLQFDRKSEGPHNAAIKWQVILSKSSIHYKIAKRQIKI